MADQIKKTLYHSELVAAGESTLDVGKTIASKKKQGTFITFVNFNGHERTYQCETNEIAEKLKKRPGQRCTVLATGAKGQVGGLKIVAADWIPKDEAQADEPPPDRLDAPPPARGGRAAEPAGSLQRVVDGRRSPEPEPESESDEPLGTKCPAKPWSSKPHGALPQGTKAVSPSAALNSALYRCVNVQLKIQVFLSQMYAELESKRGIRLSPQEKSGLAGQLFIQLNKEFLVGPLAVPTDHLIDITPKAATKPAAPAAPNPDDDGREPEPEAAK